MRGTDVTGRKFRHETFDSDFVKAHNNQYYAVGVKGFMRLAGLMD